MTLAGTLATAVADRGASWGGPVVAIVASALFVCFAGWILLQRTRQGRASRKGEADDD